MRFVLIHGGCHGAWCWAKLAPELEKLGHAGVLAERPARGDKATVVPACGQGVLS